MVDTIVVDKINSVIESYFTTNPTLNIVPVKDLMPAFISVGIFKKDFRKGLPIRKILNELDKSDKLNLIPFIYAERNEQNTYWYFKPINAPVPTTPYKQEESSEKTKRSSDPRFKNDQDYVVDLCDIVLEKKAYRQKKFDFLLGDLHKNGKTQTELPIDAYYVELQLAVEFERLFLSESASSSKRNEKETVSGVLRSEQRKRYSLRKAKVLSEQEISLVVILSTDFACDDQDNIIRNEENDIKVVQKALKRYVVDY